MTQTAPIGRPRIPRDKANDYAESAAKARRDFIRDQTGVELKHTGSYSFDATETQGNCEHFTGVAQVPLGIAGPVLVNGEHAQGEFYVPMATAEGTLVASYNRGMRLTREAGGITVTVADDAMQRAPVFAFDNARTAKQFGAWIIDNMATIRATAEATTSIGKLRNVEHYAAARFLYLRFNFTTGDAAGQNIAPSGVDRFLRLAKIAADLHDRSVLDRHIRCKDVGCRGDRAAFDQDIEHRSSSPSRGHNVGSRAAISRSTSANVL